METIAHLADVEALERIPLQARDLPRSNYESIRGVAAELPDHPALHFVFDAAAYDKPFSYTYADLVGSITRTANMLNGLGLGHDEVVSIALPSLPQTYFAFLGGEVAGIANPINPLLEPETMAEIMNAAGSKVLVTLAPFPGVDLWEKVASILNQVPSLETVLQVDLGRFVAGLGEGAVGSERTANVRARVLDFDQHRRRVPGRHALERARHPARRGRLLLPHGRHDGHAQAGAAHPLQRGLRCLGHGASHLPRP